MHRRDKKIVFTLIIIYFHYESTVILYVYRLVVCYIHADLTIEIYRNLPLHGSVLHLEDCGSFVLFQNETYGSFYPHEIKPSNLPILYPDHKTACLLHITRCT